MKMNLKLWVFAMVSGVSIAAETSDAEIIKDLDFFSSYDFVNDDAAMDEEIPDEDATSSDSKSRKIEGGSL